MEKSLIEFEKSRVSRILDGVILVGKGFQSIVDKYLQSRHKAAENFINFYMKDHSDVERYQRKLENLKNQALFYGR
jgi:hypothetical protein